MLWWNLIPTTLKVQAADFCETLSRSYQTLRHRIPEDCSLHSQRRGNLTCHELCKILSTVYSLMLLPLRCAVQWSHIIEMPKSIGGMWAHVCSVSVNKRRDGIGGPGVKSLSTYHPTEY